MKPSYSEPGPEGGQGLSFGSILLTVMVAPALVVGRFLLHAPRAGLVEKVLPDFFTGDDIGSSIWPRGCALRAGG